MTEQEFFVRILLSMLCGGLLGLERQIKLHPAGLRTLTLVCMGATLVVSTDIYLRTTFKTQDSFRLSAQVVTGVGFIGAGAIIQSRVSVKGLTTAAALWFTAAVGLANWRRLLHHCHQFNRTGLSRACVFTLGRTLPAFRRQREDQRTPEPFRK